VSTINYRGFCATFSPDGTRVASGGNGFVKIWNTDNGDSDSETVSNHVANAITFAPDGRVIASRSWYDVKIWDTTSGECLFTIDSYRLLQSVVFSPDLAFAFVAGWYDTSYAEAQVWNIHSRSLVRVVRLNFELVSRNVALSPCSGRLDSQSFSHIILWDLGSGKQTPGPLHFEFPFSLDSRIAFATDGHGVFIHSGSDIIQHWRISLARSQDHQNNSFSNSNQLPSLPLVFIPTQAALSQPLPRQFCRYKGDEWILDEDERRILWLPPDRTGSVSASKCHGRKIAVGTSLAEESI
jgi:WD domain, G-beta repeat